MRLSLLPVTFSIFFCVLSGCAKKSPDGDSEASTLRSEAKATGAQLYLWSHVHPSDSSLQCWYYKEAGKATKLQDAMAYSLNLTSFPNPNNTKDPGGYLSTSHVVERLDFAGSQAMKSMGVPGVTAAVTCLAIPATGFAAAGAVAALTNNPALTVAAWQKVVAVAGAVAAVGGTTDAFKNCVVSAKELWKLALARHYVGTAKTNLKFAPHNAGSRQMEEGAIRQLSDAIQKVKIHRTGMTCPRPKTIIAPYK